MNADSQGSGVNSAHIGVHTWKISAPFFDAPI
jgi:hypothetical protein